MNYNVASGESRMRKFAENFSRSLSAVANMSLYSFLKVSLSSLSDVVFSSSAAIFMA